MVCLLEFVDSGGRGVCDCICSGQGYDDFFFLIMDMFVHLRIINNLLFFLLLHQTLHQIYVVYFSPFSFFSPISMHVLIICSQLASNAFWLFFIGFNFFY